VRLEVEAGLEERGCGRETRRPRRVGGTSGRSARARAAQAARSPKAAGGGPKREQMRPAVGVALEELCRESLGSCVGRVERPRIGAHRGDHLEPAPRGAVVE
jgi:hypothetical protein